MQSAPPSASTTTQLLLVILERDRFVDFIKRQGRNDVVSQRYTF